MGVQYSYEYVHLKVKRVVKSQSDSEFFVADVQCVDEHGNRLKSLRNVVCSLDGFVDELEAEFSEEEIAALRASGISDPPRYQIYNDAEFRLSAAQQLAEFPSEPAAQPPTEQKFALIELICDGMVSVGEITIHDTEKIAVAEGIRRYVSSEEDDNEPQSSIRCNDSGQWIDNISGDLLFQVKPVNLFCYPTR